MSGVAGPFIYLFMFDINDLAKFYQRSCEEHDHIRASISAYGYGYDAAMFFQFFFFSYLVMNSHRATWKASHFSGVNSGLLVLMSTGTANLPVHRKRVSARSPLIANQADGQKDLERMTTCMHGYN